MTGYIYKIENKKNGKLYIGSTRLTVVKRWTNHKAELNNNKHKNQYLQSAWNKYNSKSFNFEIIEVVEYENVEKILEREQFWIDKLNCCDDGYNLQKKVTDGGIRNNKLSEDDVKKIIILLYENKKSRSKIAKQFNISKSTISDIAAGRTWTHIKREHVIKMVTQFESNAKLTIDEIKEIKKLLNNNITHKVIAEKFNINQSTVSRIKNKKYHKGVN